MTSVEFGFGMISVITSLALTRLLSGGVALYRHADRIRFSWRHGGWTAMALMLLLGNWAAFWQMRGISDWSGSEALVPLLFVSVLYAFCDLVMPEEPRDGSVLDLRAYHEHQGRRYKMLQLAFSVLAILVIARRSPSLLDGLSNSGFALVAATCSIVALRTRRVWLDTAAAVVLVAMSPLFLWMHLRGLSG